MMSKKYSRRDMLKLTGAAAGATLMAACVAPPAAAPCRRRRRTGPRVPCARRCAGGITTTPSIRLALP